MVAGGRWVGGPVDFGCMCLRPGAEQCWWTIITGSISFYGGGAARRLNWHRGHQWSLLGDSICIGCYLVALLEAEVLVGAGWVWVKCEPSWWSSRCPLAPSERGFEFASVAYSVLDCPWSSCWHRGVIVVVYIFNHLLCKYERPGWMKIGYSCDPDTNVSYCPFFLLKKRENWCKFFGWMLA
jgi:hypothetical protein